MCAGGDSRNAQCKFPRAAQGEKSTGLPARLGCDGAARTRARRPTRKGVERHDVVVVGGSSDTGAFEQLNATIAALRSELATVIDEKSQLAHQVEELRSQLAGLIAQPASGVVGVLNSAVAAVPQVLQAYVSKHEAA